MEVVGTVGPLAGVCVGHCPATRAGDDLLVIKRTGRCKKRHKVDEGFSMLL